MEQQKANDSQPVPCSMGCGFFGNPMTENCCSKCWRDHKKGGDNSTTNTQLQQHQTTSSIAHSSPVLPSPTNTLSTPPLPLLNSQELNAQNTPKSVENGEGNNGEEPNLKKVQKDTSRCFSCKKKVGLLGFKCRCNFIFCSGHRHPGDHSCDFDYKAMQKTKLEAANPQIVGAKLDRI